MILPPASYLSGALIGLMGGLGVLLALRRLPLRKTPRLEDRVLPYLRDTPRPSRLLHAPGRRQNGIQALVSPLVRDAAGALEHILGGSRSVRSRLVRAGQAPDVEKFRAEQVLWGAIGLMAGASTTGLVLWGGRGSAVSLTLMTLCLAGVGVVLRDQMLSHQAKRREALMLAEFPTIAELLALAVAAGEGAVGALDRVTRLSTGHLSGELARCLADARAGASLPVALQGLADRTGLHSLSRFVDGMVIAVERGTPLAEVLRAQAQDVREAGRRHMMEEGGRKEIAMMIPVVFLVLPVTVLFAIFPGFAFLSFSM